MKEQKSLSDKSQRFHLDCDFYSETDVKQAIKELKEDLFTDDISIYDYRKEIYTNKELQRAVEEQIDRILKRINQIFGDKLI